MGFESPIVHASVTQRLEVPVLETGCREFESHPAYSYETSVSEARRFPSPQGRVRLPGLVPLRLDVNVTPFAVDW